MNQPAKMSFLAFGAGAIGTYIGGSLALAGYRVVFLERPDVVAGLRQRGLRLQLGDQEHILKDPLLAGSLPEALSQGPFEAAFLAVKSYDTQAVLHDLAPYIADLPVLICLQNGVENEPALAAVLGSDKVIPGTVTSAVGRRAAGDIVLERYRGTGLGGDHPHLSDLAAAFQAAHLNVRTYPVGASMKWSKMLTNLMANATAAIVNLTPREVLSHPGLFRLEIRQMREALQVMDRLELDVVDLPGTPVRLLAWAVRWLPAGVARPLLTRAVGGGRGGKMPSFHIDLHSGRGQSEVDYLNGAVVRAGQRVGVPTPVNKALTQILLKLTDGEFMMSEFDHKPDKLLGMV